MQILQVFVLLFSIFQSFAAEVNLQNWWIFIQYFRKLVITNISLARIPDFTTEVTLYTKKYRKLSF